MDGSDAYQNPFSGFLSNLGNGLASLVVNPASDLRTAMDQGNPGFKNNIYESDQRWNQVKSDPFGAVARDAAGLVSLAPALLTGGAGSPLALAMASGGLASFAGSDPGTTIDPIQIGLGTLAGGAMHLSTGALLSKLGIGGEGAGSEIPKINNVSETPTPDTNLIANQLRNINQIEDPLTQASAVNKLSSLYGDNTPTGLSQAEHQNIIDNLSQNPYISGERPMPQIDSQQIASSGTMPTKYVTPDNIPEGYSIVNPDEHIAQLQDQVNTLKQGSINPDLSLEQQKIALNQSQPAIDHFNNIINDVKSGKAVPIAPTINDITDQSTVKSLNSQIEPRTSQNLIAKDTSQLGTLDKASRGALMQRYAEEGLLPGNKGTFVGDLQNNYEHNLANVEDYRFKYGLKNADNSDIQTISKNLSGELHNMSSKTKIAPIKAGEAIDSIRNDILKTNPNFGNETVVSGKTTMTKLGAVENSMKNVIDNSRVSEAGTGLESSPKPLTGEDLYKIKQATDSVNQDLRGMMPADRQTFLEKPDNLAKFKLNQWSRNTLQEANPGLQKPLQTFAFIESNKNNIVGSMKRDIIGQPMEGIKGGISPKSTILKTALSKADEAVKSSLINRIPLTADAVSTNTNTGILNKILNQDPNSLTTPLSTPLIANVGGAMGMTNNTQKQSSSTLNPTLNTNNGPSIMQQRAAMLNDPKVQTLLQASIRAGKDPMQELQNIGQMMQMQGKQNPFYTPTAAQALESQQANRSISTLQNMQKLILNNPTMTGRLGGGILSGITGQVNPDAKKQIESTLSSLPEIVSSYTGVKDPSLNVSMLDDSGTLSKVLQRAMQQIAQGQAMKQQTTVAPMGSYSNYL